MRRRKRLAGRTESGRHKNEQGSIVVEAALVMPLIIVVLLVFVVLIRLCTVQMALHSAAAQTVKQMATHIHPIHLALQQVAASNPPPPLSTDSTSTVPLPNDIDPKPTKSPLSSWSEVAAQAADWLPDPTGKLIASALRGDFRPLENMAATEIGRAVVEPLIREFADEAIIDPARIRLQLLTLPDLKKKEHPYLAIEVEYEFSLKLPFYGKPIILKEQAAERVWISDAAPARYGSDSESVESVLLQIIAIEPSPIRPGRKATVIVKTAPGAVISMDVLYKSGSSKAKHLGEATADKDGFVQWTWHVSGNTTPGIWQLTASAVGDMENSVSKHFVVEKKSTSNE